MRVSLFTRGLWTTPDCLCEQWIYGGGLELHAAHPLQALEPKVSHAGSQPSLCDQAPGETLDTRVQVSIPGWQCSMCIVTWLFLGGVRAERITGSFPLELSWPLPHAPLPMVDFNLYPLTVINCKTMSTTVFSEFCPFSKLLNLRVILGTSKLAFGIRSEGGLWVPNFAHIYYIL